MSVGPGVAGDDPHYSTGGLVPEFLDESTRQAERGTDPATGALTTEPAEPAAAVTSVSPTAVPLASGTTVTITGTNLGGSTGVTIGGTAATSVVVVNNQTITCVTPTKTAGTQAIIVQNPAGNSGAATLLTYTAAPVVSSTSPVGGTTAGGTAVTVTGTVLGGATGVTFGGIAATSVVAVNATTVTCVSPAATAGAKAVVVTTPGGPSNSNITYLYA